MKLASVQLVLPTITCTLKVLSKMTLKVSSKMFRKIEKHDVDWERCEQITGS
jgi:hypothetical protein